MQADSITLGRTVGWTEEIGFRIYEARCNGDFVEVRNAIW